MKIHLILITITFLACFSIQAQDISNQEDRFKSKPVVKMTLNDKKIWVLLDTGSSINILDVSAMKKYKFDAYKPSRSARNVIGFGSDEMQLLIADKVDLRYKGVLLKDTFFTHNITNIVASIHEDTGIAISGIIGSKLLRKYGFVIDMGNKTAKINYKKKNYEPSQ